MEQLYPQDFAAGYRPLVLATDTEDIVTVFVPAGGSFILALSQQEGYLAQWFSPATGDVEVADFERTSSGLAFTTPNQVDDAGHPLDWALVLSLSVVGM
jgi:hypothetical protein